MERKLRGLGGRRLGAGKLFAATSFFVTCIRVGEAAHPGPIHYFVDKADLHFWQLEAFYFRAELMWACRSIALAVGEAHCVTQTTPLRADAREFVPGGGGVFHPH